MEPGMNNNRGLDMNLQEMALREAQSIAVFEAKKATEKPQVKWVITNNGGKLRIKKETIVSAAKVELEKMSNNKPVNTATRKEPAAEAPDIMYLLGLRIDLGSKINYFKESYRKNFILSKSHNILISKFAEMKMGFYSAMLSLVGVSAKEIIEIKRRARESEIDEKKKLFEENEYTSELLSITGGSKKQIKAQNRVTAEIRRQIITTMKMFGIDDYFTPERTVDIQLEQCRKILFSLNDEKANIEYRAQMQKSGIVPEDALKETDAKLAKVNSYIKKTRSRIDAYIKKLDEIRNKRVKLKMEMLSSFTGSSERTRGVA